jgi:hypothetical protein
MPSPTLIVATAVSVFGSMTVIAPGSPSMMKT